MTEDELEELENQFYWQPEALNECGWHNQDNYTLVEGEPPGYRPDLDRALILHKTHCIADSMVDKNLISIPEISLIGDAADLCKRRGRYDQYSIIQALVEVQKSHGDYWKKVGQGVVKGKDIRPRCWCGKLAKIYTVGGKDICDEEHRNEPVKT